MSASNDEIDSSRSLPDTVRLTDQSQWLKWFSIVQSYAQDSGIWEFINPDELDRKEDTFLAPTDREARAAVFTMLQQRRLAAQLIPDYLDMQSPQTPDPEAGDERGNESVALSQGTLATMSESLTNE
jgi:hypothetical protein